MIEPNCVLCQVYYPGAEPHAPDRSQTCADGRHRLERDRVAVLSMYHRLAEQEDTIADERLREGGRPADPIAALLPMAPTPGVSKKPAVSGSKERQLPINVSVVDLLAPVQTGAVSDPYGDQVGHLSVATVLWSWMESWQERLFPGSRVRPLTAPPMLVWIGFRLEEIAEREPAIADFAAELAELKAHLRHALGENAPKPVVMWGIPCKRCDTVSSLVWDPDDPKRYRECTTDDCRVLMTEDEYKIWLIELVETLRKKDAPEKPALAARDAV